MRHGMHVAKQRLSCARPIEKVRTNFIKSVDRAKTINPQTHDTECLERILC